MLSLLGKLTPYRLWIYLIIAYTIVYTATFVAGLGLEVERKIAESLCRYGEYSIGQIITLSTLPILPILGQGYSSLYLLQMGLCLNYELASSSVYTGSLVASTLFAILLSVIMSIPAADITIMLALGIMYLRCRRASVEEVERVKTALKSIASVYLQHAILVVLVMALLLYVFSG